MWRRLQTQRGVGRSPFPYILILLNPLRDSHIQCEWLPVSMHVHKVIPPCRTGAFPMGMAQQSCLATQGDLVIEHQPCKACPLIYQMTERSTGKWTQGCLALSTTK